MFSRAFLTDCTPGIILHNYRAAKVIASTCAAGSRFLASFLGLLTTDESTLPRYCESIYTGSDVAESFSLWARRRVLIESMTGPGQGLMTWALLIPILGLDDKRRMPVYAGLLLT